MFNVYKMPPQIRFSYQIHASKKLDKLLIYKGLLNTKDVFRKNNSNFIDFMSPLFIAKLFNLI